MGGESKAAHPKLYINVMEMLVAEEVGRQLAHLPERVSKYVKHTEVETFALNRLPALYASSEKGLDHQYDRALHHLKPQIVNAVHQAFAAVQVDPIRLSQPLQLDEEEAAVLQALRDFLQAPELTWKSALKEIQRLQHRRKASPGSAQPAANAGRSRAPEPESTSPEPAEQHSTVWRPGTYGGRISWKPHRPHYPSEEGFGENSR